MYPDETTRRVDEADVRSPGQVRPDGGHWERIGARVTRTDVASLLAVPLVLVGVYLLPGSLKWRLAFEYTSPTVLTAFTSHYLHLSAEHLLLNLLGYALVVPTGYLLSLSSDRRLEFTAAFWSYLLAFPFLLSGLNLLFPRAAVGVGFSGVLMAFVGYLPFVLLDSIGGQLDAPVGARHSSWLFFFGLGLVAYVAVPGLYGLALATAAVLGGVRYLLPVLEAIDRHNLRSLRVRLSVSGYSELVVFAGVLFLAYPFVAFPQRPVAAGVTLNVYSHALGFCLGYIVTYVTHLTGWLRTR